jgi:hypothetical protein
MKSVRPKDGPREGHEEPPAEGGGGRNAKADFHGQKRSNETHASTTIPKPGSTAREQGKEAKLCFMGHGLMENRDDLLVNACLTLADGYAERVAALHMIEPRIAIRMRRRIASPRKAPERIFRCLTRMFPTAAAVQLAIVLTVATDGGAPNTIA